MIKDILVNLPVEGSRDVVTCFAVSGAARFGAHLTGIAFLYEPLMPIMVDKNPAGKMFWRCFNVAKRMGWRIVDFNQKQGRIEAIVTSFWFGQPSDIVVRVRPAGTMAARFDMRAATEKGMRDFGRNLALIKIYRGELNS